MKQHKKKTSGWKKISNTLYSVGAAIVILGALAKLTHFQLQGYPIGNLLLTVGLITEAVIFFISAFEKVPVLYEWDKVYPELMSGEDALAQDPTRLDAVGLDQLNTFFQNTRFDNDSIERLGAGLKNLSNTATKLNNITDASVATNDYVNSMKQVSSSMEHFKKINENGAKLYSQLTHNLGDEANKIYEKTSSYHKSIDFLTTKVNDLNDSYEQHIKKINTSFTDMDTTHNKVSQILTNLNSSVENIKSFRGQTEQLNKNLNALNQVYSNMLDAMSSNTGKQ